MKKVRNNVWYFMAGWEAYKKNEGIGVAGGVFSNMKEHNYAMMLYRSMDSSWNPDPYDGEFAIPVKEGK